VTTFEIHFRQGYKHYWHWQHSE